MKPVEIRKIEDRALRIKWSDGSQSELEALKLRLNCPCAECKENRGEGSHSAPLTPLPPKKSALKIIESSTEEQTRLERIWAVGNYALGVSWGDGHDTGIYTYDYLKSLS